MGGTGIAACRIPGQPRRGRRIAGARGGLADYAGLHSGAGRRREASGPRAARHATPAVRLMVHRLAAQARVDLDEIWTYIARESGSEAIADQLIDSVTNRFHLLSSHPHLGRAR